MSIVKLKDKKSGVTYVYESEAYWDKEKKQPRNKRTLIGKLDEVTGEIIPTRKKGDKEKNAIPSSGTADTAYEELKDTIAKKDELIAKLTAEVEALKKEKALFISQLEKLYKTWSK